MLHFDCDYMRGCHPEVMRALEESNMVQTPGYGYDEYTEEAKQLVLRSCGLNEDRGDVYLLSGGTQTNAVVIDLIAGRYEGVICVDSGHVNVHESGAIEASGHKVIALPNHDGLMHACDLEEYLKTFYADDTWLHMARPGCVYITFPSEMGTLYTKQDLVDIRRVCNDYELPLYIDGARMAYGLAASKDVDLEEIARIADIFYIGGTKCGALFGEAVVTRHKDWFRNVLTHVKAHGALLAKSKLLGVQFKTLFENDLYMQMGQNGVRAALMLSDGLRMRGYKAFIDSPTNQQFFELPNVVIDKLLPSVTFGYWGPRGVTDSKVRFVTDWSTTEKEVEGLLNLL